MINTTSQSGKTISYVSEYVMDTLAEFADLPVFPECGYGSTCFVIENSSVYMLNGDNEWKEI